MSRIIPVRRSDLADFHGYQTSNFFWSDNGDNVLLSTGDLQPGEALCFSSNDVVMCTARPSCFINRSSPKKLMFHENRATTKDGYIYFVVTDTPPSA